MDYREFAGPPEYRRWIKVGWTLDAGGAAGDILTHVAIPDGCMEVIRRLQGRSRWGEDQSECFVAGLIDRPAILQMSGDARFIGVRLWPWAWNAFAALPSAELINRWAPIAAAAPALKLGSTSGELMEAVGAAIAQPADAALFDIVREARSVGELAQRSGRSHRSLQRVFARQIGLAPRTYLRLLRSGETVEQLPAAASLAAHAADHGFADQAHMARELRSLAGASAGEIRKQGQGPFL